MRNISFVLAILFLVSTTPIVFAEAPPSSGGGSTSGSTSGSSSGGSHGAHRGHATNATYAVGRWLARQHAIVPGTNMNRSLDEKELQYLCSISKYTARLGVSAFRGDIAVVVAQILNINVDTVKSALKKPDLCTMVR